MAEDKFVSEWSTKWDQEGSGWEPWNSIRDLMGFWTREKLTLLWTVKLATFSFPSVGSLAIMHPIAGRRSNNTLNIFFSPLNFTYEFFFAGCSSTICAIWTSSVKIFTNGRFYNKLLLELRFCWHWETELCNLRHLKPGQLLGSRHSAS